MCWINWKLKRAKVGQQVPWWSGGQMCHQVPLSIVVKLVVWNIFPDVSLDNVVLSVYYWD